MATITEEMVQAAYVVAKKIYEKSISNKSGLDNLESTLGMNRNSASDYIYNYAALVEGKKFTRTTNTYGTRHYLERIYQEGGRPLLLNALSALRQHIDYYEAIGNSSVVKRKEIYEEFSKLVMTNEQGSFYPDEVDDQTELLEGKVKNSQSTYTKETPSQEFNVLSTTAIFATYVASTFLKNTAH